MDSNLIRREDTVEWLATWLRVYPTPPNLLSYCGYRLARDLIGMWWQPKNRPTGVSRNTWKRQDHMLPGSWAGGFRDGWPEHYSKYTEHLKLLKPITEAEIRRLRYVMFLDSGRRQDEQEIHRKFMLHRKTRLNRWCMKGIREDVKEWILAGIAQW